MSENEKRKCSSCGRESLYYKEKNTYVCAICFAETKEPEEPGDGGALVNKYVRKDPPVVIGFDYERESWKEFERSTMSKDQIAKVDIEDRIKKRLSGLNITNIDVKFSG